MDRSGRIRVGSQRGQARLSQCHTCADPASQWSCDAVWALSEWKRVIQRMHKDDGTGASWGRDLGGTEMFGPWRDTHSDTAPKIRTGKVPVVENVSKPIGHAHIPPANGRLRKRSPTARAPEARAARCQHCPLVGSSLRAQNQRYLIAGAGSQG